MQTRLSLLSLLIVSQFALAQQSTLKLDAFYSSFLHRSIPFYVILPPGYDAGSERYPVIYMLRGAEYEWITQTQDGSRRGRDLKSIVDGLYVRGKIGRMIYVMPGLTAPITADEMTAVAYGMFPHIDSVYRTMPTRWQRGVDGFSYGGLDEIELVTTRPDAFATAGSYDGSFWDFDFNLINNMSAESASAFGGIRFMHHSASDRAGTTNYVYVRQLVDLLASRGWKNEFAEIRLVVR
jgi:predicted alpha/beta superfamily hydrolase